MLSQVTVRAAVSCCEGLTCAALLTLHLFLGLERLAETMEVKHPAALTLAGHQVLTGLLAPLHKTQSPNQEDSSRKYRKCLETSM